MFLYLNNEYRYNFSYVCVARNIRPLNNRIEIKGYLLQDFALSKYIRRKYDAIFYDYGRPSKYNKHKTQIVIRRNTRLFRAVEKMLYYGTHL